MKKVINFLASYGFAVVLLILLTLLTLFGTLEQASSSLYDVQNKYFNSFFLVHHIGPIGIPLPGVYLLSTLLFINLTCGALIRVPKEWKRPGMLIAHSGILYMLVAGFVTYHFSTSGQMTLYPEERSNQYSSYYEWEISISELTDGLYGTTWIIPGKRFIDMKPEDTRVFHQAGLPFELMLENYLPNTKLRSAIGDEGAEGFAFDAIDLEMEAAQNAAGAYAIVLDNAKKEEPQNGILWGFARTPWVVTVQEKEYAIELRHRTWEIPFTITLDEFIRDLHARTSMASNFESVVTKTETGEADRQVNIRMNEPLRHRGYTLFQSGWGPQNAGPNARLFSTFAVVNNPADQWPLYSCIVIAIGLLIHFLQKLFSYLRAENRRRAS